MDNSVIVGGLSALGTFIATIWGKEGWNFLIKKQEIEAEVSCKEKIAKLEMEIANERHRTSQIVTGVDMMLTMFEDEFGSDSRYTNVILKVREFIKE
ncbi:MAG TPA: hypothetical protein DCW83_03025 [Saprospirales bacterium]|jgi:hypothetical protein|nr:hypothetical protein [Saprospirales bacterium]|tara:strand:- start:2522 stop:2812 length:291 start_codon:yes stop_codon:yes gene_type:complete